MTALAFSDIYNRVLLWTDTSDTTTAKANVNHAYRDLVRQTRAKVTSVTKTLTAGDASYSLSSDFTLTDVLAIDLVSYFAAGASYGTPLQPTSMEEIIQLRTTLVGGYVRLYAMRDLDNLELYPAPQSSSDTLTIYYTQAPTALSADGDLPSAVPEEFGIVIAYGGAARTAEAEDAQLASVYQQKYQQGVVDLKAWVRARTGKIPRRMRAGYPSRYPRVPHDPSTYTTGDRV